MESSKFTVVIRCDASTSIGSGHVFRCKTLARELAYRGANILFVCRAHPGHLINLLRQDFPVLELSQNESTVLNKDSTEEFSGRKLYQEWLGCSQAEDAHQTLEALNKRKIKNCDWLIVDHYGLDAQWEAQVINGLPKEITPKPNLLVIDDLADRQHVADILVDQNYFGSETEYRYLDLVPKTCKKLLGPRYAILGAEYSLLHPLIPNRDETLRILIFFGGVDSENYTGKSLEAFNSRELSNMHVDVVVGINNIHIKSIERQADQQPKTTLYQSLPSLAGLIARADLAIGAGGSTTWERACLGLPSLVIPIAENQLPIAKALQREGYIYLLEALGSINTESIKKKVHSIIITKENLNCSKHLTDGFGSQRLALAMLGFNANIYLRPVNADDENLLFCWANEFTVRANSLNKDPIDRAAHHSWMNSGLNNPNRLHWIGLDSYGCPIGQIRLDRNPNTLKARLSFSLDIVARGHGLSGQLLQKALALTIYNWGVNIEIVAEVLKTNKASQACFERALFIPDPNADKSISTWRLKLNNWHSNQ